MGVDDLQEIKELKQDIKCLDVKLDKNEENMNKRFEKNEDNMNKFMENTANAINKISEAITEMKLAMVKDYVEQQELKEVEKNINEKIDTNNNDRKKDLEKVETKLNDKININNDNRKKDNKDTNIRVDGLERDNSLKIPDIIRKIIYLALGGGLALLGTKIFGS